MTESSETSSFIQGVRGHVYAPSISIGGVLSQKKHHIAIFSE